MTDAELVAELMPAAPTNVTAGHLTAYFARISEAPDAIPRLRRFILDLAVRGKVIPQDASDEPAAELLNRIQVVKAQWTKSGEIKKPETFEQVATDEIPFAIPSGWEATRMGWLAKKLGAGSTPLGGKSVYQNTGVPFLRSQNVYDDGLRLDDVALISREIHARMCGTHVKPQDLLLNITGASIGRCALVPNDFDEGNVSQHVAIVRLFLPSIREFIHLSLTSPFFQKVIDDVQVGVSREGLSMQRLRLFPMLLPPLAEQCRIVAKVRELMALCDKMEAAQADRESRRDRLVRASLHHLNEPADAGNPTVFREHVKFHLSHFPRLTTRPEHIKQLRQTILNLAVRGQLVAQDPNDEPASELIEHIQEEKEGFIAAGEIRRKPPLMPIGGRGSPEIPSAWEWVRIGDVLIGDSQNGYSKKPDDSSYGIPILRINAGTARRDGIVAEEEHKLISGVPDKLRKQFSLEPGDLLACRFNGNRAFVGRLSLYLGYLDINPIYPDKLIRLRLHAKYVLPKLVRCFAESESVRESIEAYCATTVGNWGISASNLKNVKIPLPPLAEQNRIVAKVDELMALCDLLETQLTTSQTESSRLLEAVLHQALAPSA